MPTTADRLLRDFVRYTGDGLPGEPASRPLPTGDPASGAHSPSKKDLRDAINSVVGPADEANAAADRANLAAQLLETATDRLGPLENIDQIQTRLQRGHAVKFACYGDSTTDGNATTGWTENDGGNHQAQAPNAWPKKLKDILQQMYPQAPGMDVWNAGWSGQAMANGWALANYQARVIETYGTPDVTFIQFGANDIALAGYSLADHITQTRLLVKRIIGDGTLPVLLTCDPMVRNSPPRESWTASREIDAAKVQLAREMGIPLIDVSKAMREWLGRNTDGMQWGRLQPDGLHGGDTWHAYKASYIAQALYRDVFRLGPGETRRLPLFDSGSNLGGTFEDVTTASKNYAGGNLFYELPRGTKILDCWVWNENPDSRLVYQSIESEGDVDSLPYQLAVAGYATRQTMHTGSLETSFPPTAGFVRRAGYRQSDMAMDMGKLPLGLTRARYHAAGVLSYCGYFDVKPMSTAVGPRVWSFTGTGVKIDHLEDATGQAVVGTPGSGAKQLDIFVDASIAEGTGVILTYSQCWGPGAEYGDIAGTVLFRRAGGDYGVGVFQRLATGSQYLMLAGVPYVTISGTRFKVRFKRNADQQVVTLFPSWTATAAASSVTYTLSDGVMGWGGWMGGAMADMAIASSGASVALTSLHATVS